MSDDVQVGPDLVIPRAELEFRATRAGGPGGQHVNKTSSRIELTWNVEASRAITEEQRARLRDKLGGRMDGSGAVRVVAADSRSQAQNRAEAERRLADMVRRALIVPRKRRKTRPTRASVEERLRGKKRTSEKKRERRRQEFD